MTQDQNAKTLIEAIKKTRSRWDGETLGLSVARRVFGRKDFEWIIKFEANADFMTHFEPDFNPSMMTDVEISEHILACWDVDWDEMLKERPVGDYSLGSSDFKQHPYGTMGGDNFRAIRTALGFTQGGIATALGAGRRTVQHWEADERAIPETVAKVMRAALIDPTVLSKIASA